MYSTPQPQGVQFSRTELRQLAIAILGLSAAFTVAMVTPVYGGPLDVTGNLATDVLYYFLAALVAVASGVGLHEIMHKIVAERYGHWAEFRYSMRGLMMAFLFAFVGFIFGAPGATYISGAVTPRQNNWISAAGPLTNIALGAGFLGLVVALYPLASTVYFAFLLFFLFEIAASVNLILAIFNMIPVMPLDGAKVWAFNKGTWLAILIIAGGILGLGIWRGYLFF